MNRPLDFENVKDYAGDRQHSCDQRVTPLVVCISGAAKGSIMALKRLRDGLHRMPAPVAFLERSEADLDRIRKELNPLRALYGTARWQKLRWSVLVRDLFTCRHCKKIEANTSLLVADHIIPHRGDLALFWDDRNLQCLCKLCHDSAKQREEAGTRWIR